MAQIRADIYYYFGKKFEASIKKQKKEANEFVSNRIKEMLEMLKDEDGDLIWTDIEKVPVKKLMELDDGIYHLDFGDQRVTTYIEEDNVVFFDLKLPEDKGEIKYEILSQEALKTALIELNPKYKEEIAKAAKEKRLWEYYADVLNSFIPGKDILVPKKKEGTITVSRKRTIDIDVAFDNILEDKDNDFWKDVAEMMNEGGMESDWIDSFNNKMKNIIKKHEEMIEESPYVSYSSGRGYFENEERYVRALEEENLNLANKLTKGGKTDEKPRVKIALITTKEEVINGSPAIVKLLKDKDSSKKKYRAEAKALERGSKSDIHQEYHHAPIALK